MHEFILVAYHHTKYFYIVCAAVIFRTYIHRSCINRVIQIKYGAAALQYVYNGFKGGGGGGERVRWKEGGDTERGGRRAIALGEGGRE